MSPFYFQTMHTEGLSCVSTSGMQAIYNVYKNMDGAMQFKPDWKRMSSFLFQLNTASMSQASPPHTVTTLCNLLSNLLNIKWKINYTFRTGPP